MAGSGQRRLRFVARGQVQGVGFRPFVFSLAQAQALTGFVRNSPRGVVIEVQGRQEDLAAFAVRLESGLPPLARMTALEREECVPLPGETGFVIAPSSAGSGHSVLISPDVCTCGDCLADMADPDNRRFRYPFTNCTNCGPRYSITRSIPYDRASTSMACFPMCPDCRAEYDTPSDRRFHAQPNACPVCGPRVWLHDAKQDRPSPAGTGREAPAQGDAALRALAVRLARGAIAAVKGLGGFHLACDAGNDQAVAALRLRKRRPHKPFAVMAAGLEEARRIAALGEEEEALLRSPEHPVVICPPAPRTSETGLSRLVSPDTSGVGLMLPYTPLHQVLLAHFAEALRRGRAGSPADRPAVLVMTSGNPGGEPICLGNREALAALGGMADVFLLHDRDILVRVDDSVIRPAPGRSPIVYRRARGYAPRPIPLESPEAEDRGARPSAAAPVVLGVGAELKNTLCLTKGGDAFVSQHIGDVATVETAAFHREMRGHLSEILCVKADAVVRDPHPDYLSGDLAEQFARENGIPVLRLQHHFAHAHAVLAEHRHRGPALALTLDGAGFGEDGDLWGGEVLYLDSSGAGAPVHRRLARFAPLALPGADAAVREPWRIAHALLLRLGLLRTDASGTPLLSGASRTDSPCFSLPWLPEYADHARLLPRMLEKGVNTPWSTSCGRLFDAVSALLGLGNAVTYEGQAAIRLEEAGRGEEGAPDMDAGGRGYPCPFAPADPAGPAARAPSLPRKEAADARPDLLQLDTLGLFAAVYADRLRGTPVTLVSRRFHASLARGLAELTAYLGRRHGVRHVGLSGGCLQNVRLLLALVGALEKKGLIPLPHADLPPNDGCVSLGQAAWGRMVIQASRSS
jgi:hydrogenase maturation protein HypF